MPPGEWIFVLCIVLLLLAYLIYKQRKFLKLSWELQGPTVLPLLGNALEFYCKDEDIYERMNALVANYPSPMRLWLGPKLTIFFREIEHVEKIMSSMKFVTKDSIYKFMKEFDGESLITGSGSKWKSDRKLLTHLFMKKNVEYYYPWIFWHIQVLVGHLAKEQNGSEFSVDECLHRCVADFVNECIIGVKTNAQNGGLDTLLKQMNRMYTLVHARMVKLWLHSDFFFKFTSQGKEHREGKRDIHGFMRQALYAARRRRQSNEATTSPKSFLDMMLDVMDEHPNFATDEEIDHHLTTFYSASEDTVTTICSFLLMLLGMNKHIQDKLVAEIQAVVGERDLEFEDIPKLVYLDMCIKDVLRLFPIAPYILRVPSEDIQIGNHLLPKGCTTVVSIQSLHYNPKLWSNPNEFYPEHFLEEAVKKRPVFAFLPFSAGPRGCLGKPFAYMTMKMLMVSLLQHYEFLNDGKMEDIKLKTDITVRTKNDKYPVRIIARKK